MSLLEDVFLEDEAGEAQELERVIEGDEYDERPRYESGSDNNSEKEDEAVEDKRRVDPTQTKTKRVVKNPRFTLNPARLTGPRGIQVIPDHFKDFKFKGKGHEKEDLDLVLKKLEHWAYRLYPKFEFADCLKKIESLGRKRPVMVHLQKIRSDQFISEETVVQKDSSDEEDTPAVPEEDEFDKLLQQQIELARSTPAPSSIKKPAFSTPRVENRSIIAPKATSSPSISDEQKERMLRNRKMAEERRLARLRNSTVDASNTVVNEDPIVVDNMKEKNEGAKAKKHNRSNVIDSSDEECDAGAVNQPITVDVHNVRDDVEMEDDRPVNNSEGSNHSGDDISEVVSETDNIYKKGQDVVAVSIEDHSNNDNFVDDIYNTEIHNSDTNLVENDSNNIEETDRNLDKQTSINITEGNHDSDNQLQDSNNLLEDHNNSIKCNDNEAKTNGMAVEILSPAKDVEKHNELHVSDKLTGTPDKIVNGGLPSNNKENIDNNADLHLMDVDFNDDF